MKFQRRDLALLIALALAILALASCSIKPGSTSSVHAAASSFKANPATIHDEQVAARKLALCGAKHGLNTTINLTPPPVKVTKVSVSPSLVNAVHPVKTVDNIYAALTASVRCAVPAGTYPSVKACMQVGTMHAVAIGATLARLLTLAITCIVGAPQ